MATAKKLPENVPSALKTSKKAMILLGAGQLVATIFTLLASSSGREPRIPSLVLIAEHIGRLKMPVRLSVACRLVFFAKRRGSFLDLFPTWRMAELQKPEFDFQLT